MPSATRRLLLTLFALVAFSIPALAEEPATDWNGIPLPSTEELAAIQSRLTISPTDTPGEFLVVGAMEKATAEPDLTKPDLKCMGQFLLLKDGTITLDLLTIYFGPGPLGSLGELQFYPDTADVETPPYHILFDNSKPGTPPNDAGAEFQMIAIAVIADPSAGLELGQMSARGAWDWATSTLMPSLLIGATGNIEVSLDDSSRQALKDQLQYWAALETGMIADPRDAKTE